MTNLAKLRISKGKTQEQMAKLLGIGVSTYN
ncbi:helix-turn-helix domain-containing protein, partial [Rhodanobacter denitrificans]